MVLGTNCPYHNSKYRSTQEPPISRVPKYNHYPPTYASPCLLLYQMCYLPEMHAHSESINGQSCALCLFWDVLLALLRGFTAMPISGTLLFAFCRALEIDSYFLERVQIFNYLCLR
uniref:Uncharacterized protein n=1 Tax=Cacopsylla melanoneura TaxID=428564 RepID=A0A8D9AVR4_9HEMI